MKKNSSTDTFEGFEDDQSDGSDHAAPTEPVYYNLPLITILAGQNFFLDADELPADLIELCSKLTLAGNRDFFNTSYEAGHDDDALRAVAEIIYFRRHIIADPDISGLLMPARHPSRSLS